MGEIALALTKYRLRRGDLRLQNMKRELGDIAKATGIPLAELKEFGKIVVGELVEEAFK